ncbi:hypothetical protein [Cryocola sp. 340MFSha3.1]|uniref:hypothetical protein n=1 Tax=Cryocola sp. 340MFSha3.1 TaxID=1169145 RepID=UPI000381A288|nr:hypothetical protein [Cryocola sp. 340MFSha3.1]
MTRPSSDPDTTPPGPDASAAAEDTIAPPDDAHDAHDDPADPADGDDTTADETADDGSADDAADRTPSSEAARRRRELRETQAELESARATVARLQAQALNTAATPPVEVGGNLWRLAVPEDLFDIAGHRIEDFTTDEGTIDTTKVQTALQELHAARPRLFDQVPRPAPHDPVKEALDRMSTPTRSSRGSSWSSLIRDGGNR